MFEYLKEIRSADVGLFLAGIKTDKIGPPISMSNLADLLSLEMRVFRTKNIVFNAGGLEGKVGGVAESNNILTKVRNFVKSIYFIRQVYLLYCFVKFNLCVYLFAFVNKQAKIIITQPFLFYTSMLDRCDRLVYIRRGNGDWGCSLSTIYPGIVKYYLEKIFYKFERCSLVYLVDIGTVSRKYSVIPNHFELSDFGLKEHRLEVKPVVCFVGTWCSRKGGDLILKLVEKSSIFSNEIDINVYGALGIESHLNEALTNSEYISYKGTVAKPYHNLFVGDVFISVSKIEGLQRSMIECMLSGCLVVGIERPDTLSVKDCSGVFLVPDSKNVVNDLDYTLTKISQMSCDQRKQLGIANRRFAQEKYSPKEILEKWRKLLSE
ncbi:glycosyltransferase [Teredinibacter franksiae]|uniref:glycosyltransferase n=1 Tax=Teredinibacter franksiae TaxID=2761453 RepID=UPI00162860E2|nr:glycosyltransferase [Teredinibacter franksiae]